jgi:hypothetical protein
MSTKLTRIAAALVLITLLIGPAYVLAGPDEAQAPSDQWIQLDAGEEHWYAFEYAGHHKTVEAEEDDEDDENIWVSSKIQVLLDSDPDDAVSFAIWTPDNVRRWGLGEEVEPVGRGTENEHTAGDLCWCGTFEEPGTYYVIVENDSAGPASYVLTIDGEDISFAAPVREVEEAAVEAEPEMAAEAERTGGTGPGDALAAGEGWVELAPGETVWYTVDYRGHHRYVEDEEDEDEVEAIWTSSNIQVLLDSEPDDAVTFAVWTPEIVRRWGLGEEIDPVGRGTENEHTAGDLCWCGTFEEPGIYYVVVENEGSAPAFFQLTITGEDVLQ